MQKNTTEDFLRWVEAEKYPPPRFLFPSPNEAGFLAAVRLRFTRYRDSDIGPANPFARACIDKGWLVVRGQKTSDQAAHPRRAPKTEPPPHEQLMLTPHARAILNAIIEIGWPVETTE